MQEAPLIPKLTCLTSHEAKMLCGSKNCLQNAFICTNQGCENCKTNHKACQIYRIANIITKLETKKKKPTAAVKKAVLALQKIIDGAIQKLSICRQNLKNGFEMYGYFQGEIKFLKLLQQGCLKQISGSIIFQVLQTLNLEKSFNTDQKTIKIFWQNREKQFNELLEKLMKLPNKSLNGIDSKITNKLTIIEDFFTTPIYNLKLLYRASEHNFSVKQFHKMCDNKQNTLVLAKTEFGKVIGGFTPIQWDETGQYYEDSNNNTFLFSITKKQKYPCFSPDQAIYCRKDYGPTFGNGHDFHIGDKSDMNRNNGQFSFGSSYNTQDFRYQNDDTASKQFCGAENGIHAKVLQWEVFQIEFI